MKTIRCHLSQIFFVPFLFLLFANFVQAETINCTAMTSLPYTITTQGIYCLTADLSTSMASGNAIEIATKNVVIDLSGHKLGGLAAGKGTTANGIYASQRQNITIRNGTVRGFNRGIWLYDFIPITNSQGHIVEDIRADMNTYVGMDVAGRGNMIRSNQVVDTGGTILPDVTSAFGIGVFGPGNRVINNDVYETKEKTSGSGSGIYAYSAHGLVVANNRVGNAATGPGSSTGIHITDSTNAMVKDNTISVMDWGIVYDGSGGIYMNNLVSGYAISFFYGTAAGSTNYSIP